MKWYIWTAKRRPIGRDDRYCFDRPQPRVSGHLVPAKNGYHIHLRGQLPYAVGTDLWLIDPIDPPEIMTTETCVCRTFAFGRRLPWSATDLIDFARWCAGRAKTCAKEARDMFYFGREHYAALFTNSAGQCDEQSADKYLMALDRGARNVERAAYEARISAGEVERYVTATPTSKPEYRHKKRFVFAATDAARAATAAAEAAKGLIATREAERRIVQQYHNAHDTDRTYLDAVSQSAIDAAYVAERRRQAEWIANRVAEHGETL